MEDVACVVAAMVRSVSAGLIGRPASDRVLTLSRELGTGETGFAAALAQRRSFYESYFGVDWADPLEYHITANSGRLGPAAVELVSFAAERHWNRT